MRIRTPDPHDTWTPDDARKLLDEWQRSNESLAAFARKRGVLPRRLYWWKSQFAKNPSSALALVPATIVSEEAAIAIKLANGISIEVTNASASWVAAMVFELTKDAS